MTPNPPTMFLPVGSRRITLEDVKRWQAMETRLEEVYETTSKKKFDAHNRDIKDALLVILDYVRNGDDES